MTTPDKRCSKCHETKSVTDFHKDRHNPDGLTVACKDCRNSIRRDYYNREYHLYREHFLNVQKASRSRLKNIDIRLFKIKAMLRYAKQRAAKRGLDFDLSIDDFPEYRYITYCPVFPWIQLEWNSQGKSAPASPTIDRYDNSKGYVNGNCRIISWRANSAKRDMSPNDIFVIAEDYLRYNNE